VHFEKLRTICVYRQQCCRGYLFQGHIILIKLLCLMLMLHSIQMHGEVMIHFIHIAGTRMMEQGKDGPTLEGIKHGCKLGFSRKL